MDWKLFLTTFGTIFLAELGDKTQFAAIAASSQARSVKEVLLGVVLGLACAGTLGVVAGQLLSRYINPGLLHVVSGCAFIAVGVWVLLSKN
jgi:putative Ca2+/H+ antiporter (TMEM165/GDT1 family)